MDRSFFITFLFLFVTDVSPKRNLRVRNLSLSWTNGCSKMNLSLMSVSC